MDNLGHLADQLPRNGTGTHLATAEAELQSAFRTSALAITQLLKAAQNKSKKAFQAGYSTALQDVLEYLQQGLDIHQGAPTDGIAQIIDYIEARQEAVNMDGAEGDAEDEQDIAAPSSFQRPTPTIQQNLLGRHQSSQGYNHPSASSTFTSGIASTSRLQQQQRKRQSTRSLSPNAVRQSSTSTLSGTASSNSNAAYTASRPQPRSFPSYTTAHSLSTDPEQQSQLHHGQYRSQDSHHQLSSSLPSSPAHRSAALPNHISGSSNPSPAITSVAAGPADSPVSSVSSSSNTSSPNDVTALLNTQSPLMTRSQARKERERDRTPRSRLAHQHQRPHSSNEIFPPSSADHRATSSSSSNSSNTNVSAGMKRRWTSSLLSEVIPAGHGHDSEHHINLDTESSTEGEENDDDEQSTGGQQQQQQQQKRGQAASEWSQTGIVNIGGGSAPLANDMDMDMEGYRIDGNARPSKRMVRR